MSDSVLDLLFGTFDDDITIEKVCDSLLPFLNNLGREVSSLGPVGVASHSERFRSFCRWYNTFLDRLFGDSFKEAAKLSSLPSWMFQATRWYDELCRLSSASAQKSKYRDPRTEGMSSVGINFWNMLYPDIGSQDEGISALGNVPSLFQIIQERHGVHFFFPFSRLPFHSRLLLTKHPDAKLVVFVSSRLYLSCLNRMTEEVPQKLTLTMLELYWIKFAEYPFNVRLDSVSIQGKKKNVAIQETLLKGWKKYGARALFFGNPYNRLILDYASAYLNRKCVTFGTDGELFLRVIIEFWLNQNSVLRFDAPQQPMKQDFRQIAEGSTSSMKYNPLEPKILGNFSPPLDSVLHALLIFSSYLLSDASFKIYDDPLDKNLAPSTSTPSTMNILEILQPYIFNFLRISFDRTSLHSNSSGFSLCVELWLLWLQPWTAKDILNGRSPMKLSNERLLPQTQSCSSISQIGSRLVKEFAVHGIYRAGLGESNEFETPVKKMSGDWPKWVMSNTYLYTVLLVLFIRKAKDLPLFSIANIGRDGKRTVIANSHEEERNIAMFSRVIKAFPKSLLNYMYLAESVIASEKKGCMQHGMREEFYDKWSKKFLSERDVDSIIKHARTLEPCVGAMPIMLSQYKDEAKNALEKISLQSIQSKESVSQLKHNTSEIIAHFKPNAENTSYEKLVHGIRQIFDIDPNWQPQSASRWTKDRVKEGIQGPDREVTEWGYVLSKKGKDQVLHGERACRAEDVMYIGDPMFKPTTSFELEFLKNWLITLSVALNEKWRLPRVHFMENKSNNSSHTYKNPNWAQIEAKRKAELRSKVQKSMSLKDLWNTEGFKGILLFPFRSYITEFRINLRFLADYRVLVLINALALTAYLLYTIYAWFKYMFCT